MKTHTSTLGKTITRLVVALGCAAVIAVVAAPTAKADEGWHRGHQDHEWHDRDWRDHHWRRHQRPAEVYVAPGYYAPPPAVVYVPQPVYAAPPVYYTPPPSISFVFPLR